MKMTRFTLKAFAFLALTLAFATAAQAQATRTWVSGVGDDVNPCSRTAPCKTFAGAISKTANNGEIDCLDPGGFGTITITKSITIDGTTGQGFGSILAAGTNGVNVNDSATATPNTIVVALRNLSINGAGTGFDGIRFVSGKTLHVEGCVIANFKGNGANSDGIDAALTAASTAAQLTVSNTIVRDITGNGIRASNSGASSNIAVALDSIQVNNAVASGFVAGQGCSAQVSNSTFSFNGNGIALSTGGLGLEVDTCLMQFNTTGLAAIAATTRIANCRIIGNTNGINFTGGAVQSFGDNKVKGNTNDQNGGAVSLVGAPVKI
jgi:hypothetical protein